LIKLVLYVIGSTTYQKIQFVPINALAQGKLELVSGSSIGRVQRQRVSLRGRQSVFEYISTDAGRNINPQRAATVKTGTLDIILS
jgi:hypothetical protein